MTTDHIGQWIRQERERLGLTQTALAFRVGMTQSRISQYEGGTFAPSRDAEKRLRDFFADPSTGEDDK